MELGFRICLFIAGIINLLPSILAFIPNRINSSYGIEMPNANFELLLRHRAVLFGIVGGIMIYAAITNRYSTLAVVIGLISMFSFVVLYKLIGREINPELIKVMKIDMVGIVVLLIGLVLWFFSPST